MGTRNSVANTFSRDYSQKDSMGDGGVVELVSRFTESDLWSALEELELNVRYWRFCELFTHSHLG